MRERRFVKLRVDIYEDTKTKIIDTKPERDLIHHTFARLIVLAGKVNLEGDLYLSKNIPYTIETLAIEFNRSVEKIKLALDVLTELQMVELTENNVYRVTNFAKHQNIKVKEKNNVKDKEENIKQEEILVKENSLSNIDHKKDEATENKISKNQEEKFNNHETDNSEIVHKDIALINENTIKKSGNSSNENLSNENSNNLKDLTTIPLELKKNKRKNKEKKDVDTFKVIDEEIEDKEIFTFYEGEVILGEGESIINSWTFD